ncbi:hypothetical protein L218DRAFT_951311 [Marasmius fiardii PR-910]|nr:hypothetical protein L218DRAFT_951311 [Marasmius fiardii PR-910]
MLTISFIPLALVAASYAAPVAHLANRPTCGTLTVGDLGGLPLPKNALSYVLLGVGTKTILVRMLVHLRALVELFDVSCISNSPDFAQLPSDTLDLWTKASPSTSVADAVRSKVDISRPFGEHYFITNSSGTGIDPVWDATSGAFAGNNQAFFLGTVAAQVQAPTGSNDVNWLYLTNVTGSLAAEVYRIQTRGGQPSASCTPGQDGTVKFTTLYYLTGGDLPAQGRNNAQESRPC